MKSSNKNECPSPDRSDILLWSRFFNEAIKDIADSGNKLLNYDIFISLCHSCQSLKMSCCQMIIVVPILKLTIYFGFLSWHKD